MHFNLNEKNIINIIIWIFIIIITLIFILLMLYYFTPNNYIIIKNTGIIGYTKSEYKISIEPNSKIYLDYSKYNNKTLYISFSKETNIIVKNYFKSQNVLVIPENLIQIKNNSDVIITNHQDKKINLIVNFLIKEENN